MQINVTVAGISGVEPVKCSRDIVVVPDKSLKGVAKVRLISSIISTSFDRMNFIGRIHSTL